MSEKKVAVDSHHLGGGENKGSKGSESDSETRSSDTESHYDSDDSVSGEEGHKKKKIFSLKLSRRYSKRHTKLKSSHSSESIPEDESLTSAKSQRMKKSLVKRLKISRKQKDSFHHQEDSDSSDSEDDDYTSDEPSDYDSATDDESKAPQQPDSPEKQQQELLWDYFMRRWYIDELWMVHSIKNDKDGTSDLHGIMVQFFNVPKLSLEKHRTVWKLDLRISPTKIVYVAFCPDKLILGEVGQQGGLKSNDTVIKILSSFDLPMSTREQKLSDALCEFHNPILEEEEEEDEDEEQGDVSIKKKKKKKLFKILKRKLKKEKKKDVADGDYLEHESVETNLQKVKSMRVGKTDMKNSKNRDAPGSGVGVGADPASKAQLPMKTNPNVPKPSNLTKAKSMSAATSARTEVNSLFTTLGETFNKLSERGEAINELQHTTEQLQERSEEFRSGAAELLALMKKKHK
eukprot:TRINITY_DN5400_c0_g2_i4.p1 TRINITY_DN5400_c0_g2~~TRINITY_DN5400_c0_g2_i4.p1  ORF type:complete len:460 (-),score=117.71 TRINITY_DN5400_c0_g2_i4:55-1434(-)